MNEIKVIEGGVTAAKGFKAAGAYAGIGKNARKAIWHWYTVKCRETPPLCIPRIKCRRRTSL